MFPQFIRNSVSAKVTFITLMTGLLSGGILIGINAWVGYESARNEAIERVKTNMNVAWNELHHISEHFRLDNGQIMAGDVVLNDYNELPDKITESVGGTATIFMMDTRVATNVKKSDGTRAVGTQLAKNEAYKAVFSGKVFRGIVDILGKPYITEYDPILDKEGKVIGILYVGIPTAQFFSTFEKTLRWSIIAGVLTIAIIVCLVSLLARRNISVPINNIAQAMQELEKGNLKVSIPAAPNDEIGTMARALSTFKEGMLKNKEMEATERTQQKEKAERQKRIESYLVTYQKDTLAAMTELSQMSAQMSQTAGAMSATAEETSEKAVIVTSAAEEAAASVATVASAAEELSASITEIARQTGESQEIASRAVLQAKTSEETVQGLAAASEKISEVMRLINDIADQTNLLALNATIEAARAGEAGKGFAVVANEVKNLAGQTAKATEEVGAQINSMQEATRSVVKAISLIGKIIGEMDDMTANIAAVVKQQDGAVKEIAQNASQTSVGAQQVTENITGINQSSSEVKATAGLVLDTSNQLANQVKDLSKLTEDFVSKIQTA